MPAAAYDPGALDAPYAALDALPRPLWLQGIINARGRPAARLRDVAALRASLIAGEGGALLAAGWPYDPALAPFRAVIGELGLTALVRGEEGVADEILQTLLWHVDRIPGYMAETDEAGAVACAVEAFRADWREVQKDVEAVRAVFEVLGDAIKKENWAAIRGLLRSEGLAELVRIQALMKALPELGELIRRLGRARESEETCLELSPLPVMEPVEAHEWREQEVRLPGVVSETTGVRRGGELARLLPAELVLLRRPAMRLSWYARLAERALLAYEDEDRGLERVPTTVTRYRPGPRREPRRRREMGPLVVCVDTSASMQGGAELVAKGVVLEAMRMALAQGRRCHVFAFGGPGELVERELGMDAGGLAAALAFMAQTFQGGTDIVEPLDRALEVVAREGWQLADLLVASDGEFGATRDLVGRLREAKQALGLRVQGVLIGDRETVGLLEISDDIFWVRDWRHFGGQKVASPVHDKSLTALYFPGALR